MEIEDVAVMMVDSVNLDSVKLFGQRVNTCW